MRGGWFGRRPNHLRCIEIKSSRFDLYKVTMKLIISIMLEISCFGTLSNPRRLMNQVFLFFFTDIKMMISATTLQAAVLFAVIHMGKTVPQLMLKQWDRVPVTMLIASSTSSQLRAIVLKYWTTTLLIFLEFLKFLWRSVFMTDNRVSNQPDNQYSSPRTLPSAPYIGVEPCAYNLKCFCLSLIKTLWQFTALIRNASAEPGKWNIWDSTTTLT